MKLDCQGLIPWLWSIESLKLFFCFQKRTILLLIVCSCPKQSNGQRHQCERRVWETYLHLFHLILKMLLCMPTQVSVRMPSTVASDKFSWKIACQTWAGLAICHASVRTLSYCIFLQLQRWRLLHPNPWSRWSTGKVAVSRFTDHLLLLSDHVMHNFLRFASDEGISDNRRYCEFPGHISMTVKVAILNIDGLRLSS